MKPRHIWLRERVSEVLRELTKLEMTSDWKTYRELALELSKELNYATVEWGKYYNED